VTGEKSPKSTAPKPVYSWATALLPMWLFATAVAAYYLPIGWVIGGSASVLWMLLVLSSRVEQRRAGTETLGCGCSAPYVLLHGQHGPTCTDETLRPILNGR
jgi:hypothetical protein